MQSNLINPEQARQKYSQINFAFVEAIALRGLGPV